MKRFIFLFSFALSLVCATTSTAYGTTYYSAGSNDPTVLNNWWTNTNGTGSHPANFTTSGDIFTIQSTLTMAATADWDISVTLEIKSGGTLALSTYTVGPLSSLTLENGGTTGASITGSGVLSLGGNVTVSYSGSGTGGASIACPVALITTTCTFTVADDGTSATDLTVSGTISSVANGVTKLGTGTLSFGANAVTLNGLTISAGTLTSTSGTLYLAGNFSNSGTFTHNSGTVNFNLSGAQSISGTTTFNNLTLSGSGVKTLTSVTVNAILSMEGTATASAAPTYGGSATLQYNTATARTAGPEWMTPFAAAGGVIIANTGTITVTGAKVLNASIPLTINNLAALTVDAGAALTVGGTLTNSNSTVGAGLMIRSTSNTATGSLINGTVNVNATVERWMSGGLYAGLSPLPWHLISSPVSGQLVSDFVAVISGNAIAKNVTNYGLAPYKESDNTWDYFKASGSNVTGNLTVGLGYEVLRDNGDMVNDDDGVVSFKGSLTATQPSITIIKTGTDPKNGWNLIGNPYPCAIDITAFLNDDTNAGSIDPSYLAAYTANVSTTRYNTKSKSDKYILASGESFFVKSKTASGSIVISTGMKSLSSSAFNSPPPKWPGIELFAEAGSESFSTRIKYIPEMTKGLDPGWDAGLFNTDNPSFALFTRLIEDNGVNFDIQSLPDNDYENLVVPVGLIARQGAEVVFKATVSDFPEGYKVYLEDKVTGKFTRLDEYGNFYSVVLNTASTGAGRFYVHTKQGAVGIADEIIGGLTIIPLPQQQIIRLSGMVNLPAQVSVFDMTGRMVKTVFLTGSTENEIPVGQLIEGVYMLRIQSDQAIVNRKISWNN